jgi:hypothetical protein
MVLRTLAWPVMFGKAQVLAIKWRRKGYLRLSRPVGSRLNKQHFYYSLRFDHSPFPLEITGTKIIGSLNGTELIRYDDDKSALLDGGIALVCEEGLIMTDEVKVIAA